MKSLFTILFFSVLFLATQRVTADVGGLGPVMGDRAEAVESHRRDEERKKLRKDGRDQLRDEQVKLFEGAILPGILMILGLVLVVRSFKSTETTPLE